MTTVFKTVIPIPKKRKNVFVWRRGPYVLSYTTAHLDRRVLTIIRVCNVYRYKMKVILNYVESRTSEIYMEISGEGWWWFQCIGYDYMAYKD